MTIQTIHPISYLEAGCAVAVGELVGLVRDVERSRGLAWVVWPDDCGLPETMPIAQLQMVATQQEVVQALQALTARLLPALSRSFLASDSRAEPRRPYYRALQSVQDVDSINW